MAGWSSPIRWEFSRNPNRKDQPMKEELQALTQHLRRLEARCWAQEILLLAVAQRSGLDDCWEAEALDNMNARMLDMLRFSALSDEQIQYVREEWQALLQRLGHRK